MSLPNIDLGSEKTSALISLSNHAYDETKRYRDHVWQMLVWTVGLLLATLAAARTTPRLTGTVLGKILGIIFVLFVALAGAWDIYFDYTQFVWNRNLLRKCEHRLQFYSEAYGGELLNPLWATTKYKFRDCLPHFLQWVIIIAAVAAYCIYAILVA